MGTELTPTSRSISFAPESDGRPQGNYLYKQSLDQKFRFGKRIMTFDGRIFKYGHAKTALKSAYLAANAFPVSKHITYAVLPVAVAAGDMFCTVTYPSTAGNANVGFAADELVGGYIVIGNDNNTTTQNRVIIANDAMSATTGTARIYVDGAFEYANTTSNGAEVYPNPYAYLSTGGDLSGFMGVPAIATTILYNSFIQTWGPCWVVPGGGTSSSIGKTAGDRTVYGVGDGSVNNSASLVDATSYQYRQVVGYLIDTTSASVAGLPLVMLQISI